ncbi:hypothetical protein, partial [Arthrobacter sp. HMSC06H05]|uniref:hypothetical protein n=1 Tax=Arthrobacter sp. HMSC06H05 TaxID=1581128 RepID=UPI001C405AFA
MPRNNSRKKTNALLPSTICAFLIFAGSEAHAVDVSFQDQGVETSNHIEQNTSEETQTEASYSGNNAAAAPKVFGKRLLWDPACTPAALDRSGAVTGSTKVAGSDLHVAEVQDPVARNAAKTQACTRRAVDECGQRDDLL